MCNLLINPKSVKDKANPFAYHLTVDAVSHLEPEQFDGSRKVGNLKRHNAVAIATVMKLNLTKSKLCSNQCDKKTPKI